MLISTAYAQAAGGSTEQQILGFLPIILMGVLFGLALFQVILVLSTSLPVMKKLREGAKTDHKFAQQ